MIFYTIVYNPSRIFESRKEAKSESFVIAYLNGEKLNLR